MFAPADRYADHFDGNGNVTEEDVLVVDLAGALKGQVAFTPSGGSVDQEQIVGSPSGS